MNFESQSFDGFERKRFQLRSMEASGRYSSIPISVVISETETGHSSGRVVNRQNNVRSRSVAPTPVALPRCLAFQSSPSKAQSFVASKPCSRTAGSKSCNGGCRLRLLHFFKSSAMVANCSSAASRSSVISWAMIPGAGRLALSSNASSLSQKMSRFTLSRLTRSS